ncbi:hypothetical protein OCU04_007347 [Sclerotinia nivalis]|uniref:Uncharacterized protein n=1 Tax=Sclerotinia nivalis TaxID=352851 RepID=A0A9X0AIL1_9HELO|nr:hypothetical protein OCU04_007347 [Sclerotinia nivalis]
MDTTSISSPPQNTSSSSNANTTATCPAGMVCLEYVLVAKSTSTDEENGRMKMETKRGREGQRSKGPEDEGKVIGRFDACAVNAWRREMVMVEAVLVDKGPSKMCEFGPFEISGK